MQTILVPIDFSGVSRLVIDQAIELARIVPAEIILINVVQQPLAITDFEPIVGESLRYTAEVERSARRHLKRLVPTMLKRGVQVDTVCEQGSPVPLIISQAKKRGVRYIALGSHGHTARYDLVIGSTASGVIKRASCPVMVVPALTKTKSKVRLRPVRKSTRAARKP